MLTKMFDICMKRLLSVEGGFQKDYYDRGNWTSGVIGQGSLKGTKYGLTAMNYPDVDIEGMSEDTAKMIYERDWWIKFELGKLPSALQYLVFDAAIHHGNYNATRLLQKAVGTIADGVMGPKTRKAISEMDAKEIAFRFLSERLKYMTDINAWSHNAKGWTRRIAENLKFAAEDTSI